jgi:hypothetical protein
VIFETYEKTNSKPQPKLTWVDAILPTLIAYIGTILLSYALLQLLGAYLIVLTFAYEPRLAGFLGIIPVAAVILLLALSTFAALAWKRKGREAKPSFYYPPFVLVLGVAILNVSALKVPARQPTPAEISARELSEFKRNLNDPKFVMNLKGPLPMDRRLILISRVEQANSWFSGMKPEELHALLVNVGMEIEPYIAQCPRTLPEDLDWLARNGGIGARKNAAINPNTPEDDVIRLLTDPDPDVQYFARRSAARRVCDPALLDSIFYRNKTSPHYGSDVDLSLAKNPCTKGLTLGFLNGNSDPAVRKAAEATLKNLSSRN